MPSKVSQAPRALIPSAPRGINIPLKAIKTRAAANISENQVQARDGL